MPNLHDTEGAALGVDGVEGDVGATGTDARMEVAGPVLIAVGRLEGLGRLQVGQECRFIIFQIDAPEFGVTPAVRVGVSNGSVGARDKRLVAVAVELWRYVAPRLHRVVAEEVVAVDGADAAEGEDAVGSVPDIVRHHVGGGGDMDVCAVEATGDEAREPLVGVIEGPAVEEGDALVVRRELGMGDEVAGTLHILRRFHLGEVGEGEEQRARVLLDVDEVEASVFGGGLVEVAAVFNVVAVARHHSLQTTVAEGRGVAAVVADGVDGVSDELRIEN